MKVKAYVELSFNSQIEQAKTPRYAREVETPEEAAWVMREFVKEAVSDYYGDNIDTKINLASDGSDGMYDANLRSVDSWGEFEELDLEKILPDVDATWFDDDDGRCAILILAFNVEGTKEDLAKLANLIQGVGAT